ncbi:glycoside hydrolase family 97 protein [Mucilaginibacter psychrotolerans]|uniref:Glycoside hydrolase family 97 protein n=1 Tax=Mucilaginibacter psychrotolerans TaxID=1524096 RepID=A0A4Y8SF43_9SPHI|nr:glycoside hydrolase family 97 protein [Mucilaginibacter psychrotolerans]TFF37528.1 glycoside hydrolase family 97 protein [Mucilaginibacter psychrotolerans]
MKNLKAIILGVLIITCLEQALYAQKLTLQSPNKKITIELFNQQNSNTGEWYLKVLYTLDATTTESISRIDLGLIRADQAFSKELTLVKAGRPVLINERYTSVHGKRSVRSNAANEIITSFQNPDKTKINLILRAYNDGVAFRYEFPEGHEAVAVKDELTAFTISRETSRWMEKWNTANEGYYTPMSDDKVQQQEWCYPALFNTKDKTCWFLLHEADLDRNYCGTKLSNTLDATKYKLTFPDPRDGRGTGTVEPTITFPWKSPWRVVIMGTLQDIVASTLTDDLSAPSVIKNTDWIKPGPVSWNYWSSNHGTKDYKIVTRFADLAADMNWPYTLLDWEWDGMGNGGNLEDALNYIRAKGVKPLMWYNSGGNHTYVSSTPKDRMLTHESRVIEFTKLKKLGVAGVKIDFFESEKQNMIQYYLDILNDAAQFQIMVYFHGSLVPRGWARTYPNLMTYEAVRGAEWYNNTPDFTMAAPEHNAILPFTRNVVGSMDYTPVTFTNSQYPHVTSYGHELALSVLFESALQHFADRPEGYYNLPDAPKAFLREIPTAWDDTRLLDGYPGKEVILARRKGNDWYIGGINAELREKKKSVKLDFLADSVKYKLTLITDGEHDKAFSTQYLLVDKNTSIDVPILRRGGFAAVIKPEL